MEGGGSVISSGSSFIRTDRCLEAVIHGVCVRFVPRQRGE